MTTSLFTQFNDPASHYRGRPFWSWNGRLDREELFRQIGVIKAMGFGGFFMHSRTGLETPYLGEAWFELINACADEAERLGLEAWLYDEDRWPSGTAGGMVTARPEFRMKALRLRVVSGGEFVWSEDLVAAFACELDGLAFDHYERMDASTPPEAYRGRTVLAFSVETHAGTSFYNGESYVDTLNREATDYFLELTHEQYRQHCGERLGRSIKGIFTDEPHRGPLLESFAMPNPDPQWTVPWTYCLFGEFEKRFGYDLVQRLPELFLRHQGRPVSQVKWHFVELLQQLFLENYALPCAEWCRNNNLILTGHVLHEDSLAAQTSVSGSVMRYYEQMDWPGVDVLGEGNRAFWIAKQLQSAARQLGRPWLLSELYGCTGWQMGFAGHKAVGDWQALFGINVRCPHLSWYTMAGEAKRDYPASILHQSAWWPEYAAVETYFARLGLMMQQGVPECELLVLNPVESLWCQVYPGWAEWLAAKDEAMQRLERNYSDLFHWLSGAQLDFDYGDEEMLGRLGVVEQTEAGPRLRLGQAGYRAVLVSGMLTLRSTTLKLLEAFAQVGGRVIFAGETPTYVDALESDAPARLAERSVRIAFDEQAVVQASRLAVDPPLTLAGPQGEPLPEVFAQLRRDGERTIVMLLNVNREQAVASAHVRVRAPGEVQQWDCLNGQGHGVAARRAGEWLEFETHFAPAGEQLFVIGPAEASCPSAESWQTASQTAIDGPFEYQLAEPNVCVLDFAQWCVRPTGADADEPWQDAREILKVDRAVRDRLGLPRRSGEMLQPWFEGQRPMVVRGRVKLRFEFFVEHLPTEPIALAIERPEECAIQINAVPIEVPSAPGWWIDRAFTRLPVPAGVLRPGRNEVSIELDYHQRSGLESVFLLGSFGVTLDEVKKTLTTLPERLGLGDLASQALPFYSGRVTLCLPNLPCPAEGERAFLTLPALDAACACVGGQVMPWQPYEAEVTRQLAAAGALALEVVLTRRNTFGPLHMVPRHSPWYGPGEFVSEGEAFSDAYMLWPAGLPVAPILEMRRPAD